jgi:hypothetical protein
MSFSDNMSAADLAAITGNNNGWSGDASWIIILFLFMFMGWGGRGFGNFGGGNAPGGYGYEVQNGFDHAAVINSLNGINTSINAGFAGAEVSRCNAQANILQQMNNDNTAVLQQLNNMALGNLGSLNNVTSGIADVKYTISSEACADRSAVTSALQQLEASNTRNTQAILDKLCSRRSKQRTIPLHSSDHSSITPIWLTLSHRLQPIMRDRLRSLLEIMRHRLRIFWPSLELRLRYRLT